MKTLISLYFLLGNFRRKAFRARRFWLAASARNVPPIVEHPGQRAHNRIKKNNHAQGCSKICRSASRLIYGEGHEMKPAATAVAIGLATLPLTGVSFAQTADDIFRRAQERLSQEEKIQASWTPEAREAADRTLDNLKATRCSSEDTEVICQFVVLCSRAPEITGDALPDDKELMKAKKALDDVEDDLKEMASAIDQLKVANARFQRGARAARDKCEAKVRMAYRSVSNLTAQPTKSDPDLAVEADPANDIYNGPVAIRPMVTAPQLMRKVRPTATNASQTPSSRP
jgi:hypothetical protein